MKIRQTKDYKIVAKLNKPVHDLHANLYPEIFKEYNYESMVEYLKEMIIHPNFSFLLLEDNDQAIGYAWVELVDYPENLFRHSYKSIFVRQISIIETARKKGYGSELMKEVYRIAKKNRAERIELDYWVDNSVARDFYQKHGFVKNREFVYKEI